MVYLIVAFDTEFRGGGIGFIDEFLPVEVRDLAIKKAHFNWDCEEYEIIGKTDDVDTDNLRCEDGVFYYHGGDCC